MQIHLSPLSCLPWATSGGPKYRLTAYVCWWINAFLQDTILCLLWCRKLYSKLKWHGGASPQPPPPPPGTSHPSSLSSLFFIYISIYASVPQASPKSIWFLLGVRSQHWECHIKGPSIQPAKKRGEQRGRKTTRENLGQILFHTHTANLSMLMEKLQRTSVVLRWESINLRALTASLVRTVWLWLPRSSFYCFTGFGKMF